MSAPLEENLENRGTDPLLENSHISPARPSEQGKGGTREILKRAARSFPELANRALVDSSSTATTTTLHPDRHIVTTEKGGGLFRGKSKVREDNGTDYKGSVGSSHHHWCTRCEHPKIIDTCDGWKRHMKEHEQVWLCNICARKNPFMRMTKLVRHLSRDHKLSKDAAIDLAYKLKHTDMKKAYACGFCIQSFRTHSDQLNHIEQEHWRRNQTLSEWDLNKVILGLLIQPNIESVWLRLVRDTSSANRNFTWNSSDPKVLIRRLEKGEEPADDLAAAALSQLRPIRSSPIPASYWSRKHGTNRPRVKPFQRVGGTVAGSSLSAQSLELSVDSVASSRTSVASEKFALMVADELVSWLLQNAELGIIYQAVLESGHVGVDRFERNFRHILNQYSRDLKKEAQNMGQISAAVLVRRRSRYISNKLRQKLEGPGRSYKNNHMLRGEDLCNFEISMMKMAQYLDEELSNSDTDTSEDDLDDILPARSQIYKFMSTSRAFLALRATVWHLVDDSLKLNLKRLTTEIECCRATPIVVSHEATETIPNRIKGVIEDLTRVSWDWWPLKPRRRHIPAGYARIRWYCVSALTCNVARANSTSLVARSVAKTFQCFLQSRSFGLRPVPLDPQLSSMPLKELVEVNLLVMVRPVILQHRLQRLIADTRAYTRIIFLNVIPLSSKRSA